jgi:hypothetical protein
LDGSIALTEQTASAPFSGAVQCSATDSGITQAFDMAWRGDPTSLGAAADWTFSGVSPGFSVTGSFFAQTSVFLTDTITIAGGSGTGTLQVSVNVHGTTGTTGEMRVDPCVAVSGAIDCGIGTFVYEIPFTADLNVFIQPVNGFQLTVPAGSFLIHAFGDFLNSADFSFLVLDSTGQPAGGTTITSNQDGFVYPQQLEAVPEPATLLLVGAGLAAVARSRRRRAAQSSDSRS